jgi:glycosyltransferase involved in cell wall biosynthesis
MKLTVITPVFNGEKYLAGTVDSVLASLADKDFEYIVVNDGSTDGSLSILEGYKNQIILLSQENQGQSSAINNALRVAEGELCMIVNADDPITNPCIYECSVEYFSKDSEVVATYPWWSVINAKGELLTTIQPPVFSDLNLIGRGNCLLGPGSFFRLDKALEIGGWNVNYKFMPDYDFWLRLSRRGKIMQIPKILATWRHHVGSTSVSGSGEALAKERIAITAAFIRNYKVGKFLSSIAMSNAYIDSLKLSMKDLSIPRKFKVLRVLQNRPAVMLFPNFWVITLKYSIPTPIFAKLVNFKNQFKS